MVSRRGVCARLEVSSPREERSHKAADRADIVSTCVAPFNKVNYFKADRLLLEEMDMDWNQCAHGDADSHNTLCENRRRREHTGSSPCPFLRAGGDRL